VAPVLVPCLTWSLARMLAWWGRAARESASRVRLSARRPGFPRNAMRMAPGMTRRAQVETPARMVPAPALPLTPNAQAAASTFSGTTRTTVAHAGTFCGGGTCVSGKCQPIVIFSTGAPNYPAILGVDGNWLYYEAYDANQAYTFNAFRVNKSAVGGTATTLALGPSRNEFFQVISSGLYNVLFFGGQGSYNDCSFSSDGGTTCTKHNPAAPLAPDPIQEHHTTTPCALCPNRHWRCY